MGMVPIAEPLARDIPGKVHGDLPDHVPDNWTREDAGEDSAQAKYYPEHG